MRPMRTSPTLHNFGARSTSRYRRLKRVHWTRPVPAYSCGELAAWVAIEQNKNYIEPRCGLRRHGCEANPPAKEDCFSSQLRGESSLEDLPVCGSNTAQVLSTGGVEFAVFTERSG